MKAAIKAAFPLSLPVLFGYVPLGIGYGVLMQKAGFGLSWALVSALTILSGTGQYISVEFLSNAAAIAEVVIVMFVLNFRYMFYGLSFLDRCAVAGWKKWYIAFGLTDETYAILAATPTPKDVDDGKFMLSLAMLDHMYWIAGCVLGVLIGTLLKFDTTGIEFIMTALFVVLCMDQWKNFPSHEPAIEGLVCSVAALVIFGPSRFMIPALIAITAILVLRRRPIERKIAAKNRNEIKSMLAAQTADAKASAAGTDEPEGRDAR